MEKENYILKREKLRIGLFLFLLLLVLFSNFTPIVKLTIQTISDDSSSPQLSASANPVLEYQNNCKRLSHIDENYGSPRDIFVQKRRFTTIAFIADYKGGLVIVDVSNPANPKFISQLTGFTANFVFVSKKTAYVGCPTDEIIIIDVSNMKHPKIVDTLEGFSILWRITGNDELLLVSDLFGGLFIFDISSPHKPVELKNYPYDTEIYDDMIIRGNYLFLYGKELIIFELTDPTKPTEIGRISVNNLSSAKLILFEDWIFLYDFTEGIFLLDIYDYSQPQIIDHYNESGLNFLSGFVAKNQIYFLTNEGLLIFNGEEISSLQIIDEFPLAKSYNGLFFQEDILYLYDSSYGIDLLSIGSTSSDIHYLGYFGDGGSTQGVVVKNSQIYLANGLHGFSSYDASNPYRPKKLSQSSIISTNYNNLVIESNLLFAFNSRTNYMDVYNITDPANLIKLTNDTWRVCDCATFWSKTVIQDSKAFILQQYIGGIIGYNMKVFDFSDLNNVTLLNEYRFGASVDFKIQNNILYSVTLDTLKIYDITNTKNFVSIANFTIPNSYFNDIIISGDFAFIADILYGLRIIDISDFANPFETNSYRTTQIGSSNSGGIYLALEDDILYMVDRNEGLLIFDISNISHPEIVGQYYFLTEDFAIEHQEYGINLREISVDDTIVCLAADYDGVIIIHLNSLPLPHEYLVKRNIIIISCTISILVLLGGTFVAIYLYKKKKSKENA